VVVTAHHSIDYAALAEGSSLVVDLRNVVPDTDGKVWRL
jgi:UDP-N-acetyl-D-glucosamine dehydrogenase